MTNGFKEKNGSRDRNIEAVEATEHRNADVGIGGLPPLRSETRGLSTHDNGRGTTHIGVVIEVAVLKLSGKDGYAVTLEPRNTLLRRAGNCRNGKDGSDGRTDKVGIVKVRARVADDDARGAGSVGRAEHSAQIAGLLHALEDNIKSIGRETVESKRAGTHSAMTPSVPPR